MPQTNQIEIVQYNRGTVSIVLDDIISETLLTLLINDTIVGSFICSWMHIEYLVIGYLFCEGWITSMGDLLSLEVREPDAQALVYIPKSRFQNKNRDSFLSSGCGHKMQSSTPLVPSPRMKGDFSITPSVVIDSMKQFQKASTLFQSTGGVHSVALVSPNREWILEEDIGRHNALDKAIGFGLQHGIPFEKSFIMTSGRISSDMVQKIVPLPIPLLISKSAATDAAIQIANRIDLTLIGFARGERFNIYTQPDRIQEEKS